MAYPRTVDVLLTEIRPLAEKDRADAAENTPEFHALSFFSPGEVISTKILAYFLNPQAPHCQNYTFLGAFLEALGIELGGEKPKRVIVSVNSPCYTETSRRQMDLLIQFSTSESNYAIVIENKSHGAGDQPNQIKDYLEYLRIAHSKEQKLLFYLKDGCRPSNESIPEKDWEEGCKAGICRALSYHDVMCNWFETSLQRCKAPKLSAFLGDFVIFTGVKEKGGTSMHAVAEKIEKIIREKASDEASPLSLGEFEAVLAIYEVRDQIWETAVRIFVERIRRILEERMPGWMTTKPEFEFQVGKSSFCLGVLPPGITPAHPTIAVYVESDWDDLNRTKETMRFAFYIGRQPGLPDSPGLKFNSKDQLCLGKEAFVQLDERTLANLRVRTANAVRNIVEPQAAHEIAIAIHDFALEQQPQMEKYHNSLIRGEGRTSEPVN